MATANMEIVRLRGRGNALDFTLDDTVPVDALQRELRLLLDRKKAQLAGSTVSLNVGRRLLQPVEVAELCGFLERTYQIRVTRLWSSIERLEEAISTALPAPVTLGEKPVKRQPSIGVEGLPEALVVRRTCRTGASVRYSGAVIVLGNVNPGAEIVADGDIIVMGALRGLAHAGASGDRGAVILALSMGAAQLRIADRIAISPADQAPGPALIAPELAFIYGNAIVVEPYAGSLPDDLGFDVGPDSKG